MKLVAIALLAGCLHAIPVNPREHCAGQGMVMSGMVGDDAVCKRPETAADICDMRGAEASLRVKDAYEPGFRNALIGLGYVAFVIPGLVLYGGFDWGRDQVIDEATAAATNARASCAAPATRRIVGPPGS